MINYYKNTKRLINISRFLLENNKTPVNKMVPFIYFVNQSSQTRLYSGFLNRDFLISNNKSLSIISRNKTKGRKKVQREQDDESSDEEEEEEDDDNDDYVVEKGSELKTITVNSLRTDSVLKNVFRISRRKLEEVIYENKIRVNGKVLLKKSNSVKEGDEIDMITKMEDYVENTVRIGRIKILKVKPHSDDDKFIIKALRSKSMIIENYDGANSWKESENIN